MTEVTSEADYTFVPSKKGYSDLDEESREFLLHYVTDRINEPLNLSRMDYGRSVADGVTWEEPMPLPPDLFYGDASNTALIVEEIRDLVLTWVGNVTRDAHEAALSWPSSDLESDWILHETYDVSVPVDKMVGCLEGILALLKRKAPDNGLRGFVHLAFAGKETGLLSVSYDKPQMKIIFDDNVYYNQE